MVNGRRKHKALSGERAQLTQVLFYCSSHCFLLPAQNVADMAGTAVTIMRQSHEWRSQGTKDGPAEREETFISPTRPDCLPLDSYTRGGCDTVSLPTNKCPSLFLSEWSIRRQHLRSPGFCRTSQQNIWMFAQTCQCESWEPRCRPRQNRGLQWLPALLGSLPVGLQVCKVSERNPSNKCWLNPCVV